MLVQEQTVERARVEPRVRTAGRVLLVGNFLSEHGLSRGVCEELATVLQNAGWQVLTTSHKRNRLARLLDTVSTIWRTRHAYSVAQVDVFSGPAFGLAEAAAYALRAAKRPYVLTLHGGNLPAFAQRWPRRVRGLLGSAAVVTTPSKYLHSQMSPYCPHLTIVPNAIRLESYPFRPRLAAQPNLMWLRAFNQIYNPVLALRVVDRLKNEFPAISLAMAGADKGDGSLEATHDVRDFLQISQHIRIRGAIAKPAVPDFLNEGDIFINTTNFDNTPVSVLEAMACGLCVVTTNVGGLPYLLDDEHDALLVPPDNPDAMAGAVRRVLCEPGLAKRLSENGRRKAQQFDWSVILTKWQELLSDLSTRN